MVNPRQSDRNAGQTGIHLLSAWASSCRLVLGQVKVDNKSNEITAIPELLKLLVLGASLQSMRWELRRRSPPASLTRKLTTS